MANRSLDRLTPGELSFCAPSEVAVAETIKQFAACCGPNERKVCELDPHDFVEQVMNMHPGMDDGDWLQPLFCRAGDAWQLCKFEVLYRLNDARGVPFPSFVNFVRAASDQSPNPDIALRESFCIHAVASLQRVDARLSQLDTDLSAAMASAGILTYLNFTAKQLASALAVPVQSPSLIALEETEYDDEPEGLAELRQEAWKKFGAYSLDDVKPTLAEVEELISEAVMYSPPECPRGHPYKALSRTYNHDVAFAGRFIADFERTQALHPKAQADLKLDEEFCCYLIGVGHAPFSRASMAAWRERHPEMSAAIRGLGARLIRRALEAGMSVCLEVTFHDEDIGWLLEAVPELQGRLLKQGGLSGALALPQSMMEDKLLLPQGKGASLRLESCSAPLVAPVGGA